jgi:hypothetical protein
MYRWSSLSSKKINLTLHVEQKFKTKDGEFNLQNSICTSQPYWKLYFV